METYFVYLDESGDDGVTHSSSPQFILTGLYMPASKWKENYSIIKVLRNELKIKYGFHVGQEMHTKAFLTDKSPYREYGWTQIQKREILCAYLSAICRLDISIVNVIIDKSKINTPDYRVLPNALTYNIQRIENDRKKTGAWNYIIFTDGGRIAAMRKIGRAIRAYNPVKSKYTPDFMNQPIEGLIEDIIPKDSQQSYFVQIADFISYFVNLYFKCFRKGSPLPNRVQKIIDEEFVNAVIETLKQGGLLNLKASATDANGFVVFPK